MQANLDLGMSLIAMTPSPLLGILEFPSLTVLTLYGFVVHVQPTFECFKKFFGLKNAKCSCKALKIQFLETNKFESSHVSWTWVTCLHMGL